MERRPPDLGDRIELGQADKYTIIPSYTLVADSVYCDYDPIKKKADIGSNFLERSGHTAFLHADISISSRCVHQMCPKKREHIRVECRWKATRSKSVASTHICGTSSPAAGGQAPGTRNARLWNDLISCFAGRFLTTTVGGMR